jgi:hypothetical protein
VFSGVLEYIFDLDRLIAHLRNSTDLMIVSYASTDFPNQQTSLQRRKHGWVNDLNGNEFVSLFARHSFERLQSLTWENQFVYKFARGK